MSLPDLVEIVQTQRPGHGVGQSVSRGSLGDDVGDIQPEEEDVAQYSASSGISYLDLDERRAGQQSCLEDGGA